MSLISNINQPQFGKDVLPAPSVSIVEKELNKTIPHEEELTKATKLSIAREFHELSHAYPRSIYNLMKRTGKYKWPDLMSIIEEVDNKCMECELNNVSKVGFHPLKSVDGSFPGDVWIIDLLFLPKNKNTDEKY
eukprot:Awhi_evm1s12270